MKIFEYMEKYGYEQLVFCHDKTSGLKAIIAIHDTTLGPALGGTRMWNYQNEDDAILDVLRLARGMTYKAAAAGLDLGGGKAVIIGDPKKDKSEAMWRAFGRFVQSLNGRYITKRGHHRPGYGHRQPGDRSCHRRIGLQRQQRQPLSQDRFGHLHGTVGHRQGSMG